MTNDSVTGRPTSEELGAAAVFSGILALVAWVVLYFGSPVASGWMALVLCILASLLAIGDMLSEHHSDATCFIILAAVLGVISAIAFLHAGKEHLPPTILMFVFAAGLLILAVMNWVTKYPRMAVA